MINIKKVISGLYTQPSIQSVLEQELKEAQLELNKSEAAREEWSAATQMYKIRIERLTEKLAAFQGESHG